jgi:hypothetical protein
VKVRPCVFRWYPHLQLLLAEHLQHVCVILNKLREHHLFMKQSKCAFDRCEVAYLGHVISAARVTMDDQKVRVVVDA